MTAVIRTYDKDIDGMRFEGEKLIFEYDKDIDMFRLCDVIKGGVLLHIKGSEVKCCMLLEDLKDDR